jgi:hypothetical protein
MERYVNMGQGFSLHSFRLMQFRRLRMTPKGAQEVGGGTCERFGSLLGGEAK